MLARTPLLLAVAALVACAHKAPRQESFEEQIRRATQPVPADLREEVTRAESIGAELYEHDTAAWIATDALRQRRDLEQLGLGGYLVLKEGDEQTHQPTGAYQVLFYSRDPQPLLLSRVRVTAGKTPPEVELLDPPVPLPAGTDVLMRARATAIDSLGQVDQPLNPVVMPGAVIGEAGILVHLIAGTTMPRHAVFGRHHRILVSEDGTRVLRAEPLSKSALVMPIDPPEGGPAPEALIITHLVSATPVETHVLVSLRHKLRVLVATEQGDWLVDGARITYLGPRAE